ncbi:MAG TPA: hypothetical protein VK188_07500 [Holophaga sp.]|nr:hypothetical protein [Holophaga sp.]
MPRPANPGWYPKTMSLSAEVIEAVWVLAARTGRSPGKVVNELLASALLGETAGKGVAAPLQAAPLQAAPEPAAPEPAAPVQAAPMPAAPMPAGPEPVPAEPPAPEPPSDDPAVTLLAAVAQPWKTPFGTRIGFFQELSARCGEPISHRALADWQAEGRIPEAYVAHVQAMLSEGART